MGKTKGASPARVLLICSGHPQNQHGIGRQGKENETKDSRLEKQEAVLAAKANPLPGGGRMETAKSKRGGGST